MHKLVVTLVLFTLVSSMTLASNSPYADKSENLDLLTFHPTGICETLSCSDGILAIGNGASVDFYDVGIPSAPELLGNIVAPGRVILVEYFGATTFMVIFDFSANRYRVSIIDSSDPADASILGVYSLSSRPQSIVMSGSIVYVSTSNSTVIVDISMPDSPTQVGTTVSALSSEVRGSRLYLGDAAGTLQIMDISTPTAPVELGFIDYPSSIYDLAISDDEQTAYLGLYGLQIVDISTPGEPSHLAEFSLSEYFFVSDLAVTSAGVYILGDDSTYLIDVTTPETPVSLGDFSTSRYDVGICADAGLPDYCFVSVGSGTLALDFSDPAAPTDAASMVTGYFIRELTVQDILPSQKSPGSPQQVQITTASAKGGIGRYNYQAPLHDPFQVLPSMFATLFGVNLEGLGVVKTGDSANDPVAVSTTSGLSMIDAYNSIQLSALDLFGGINDLDISDDGMAAVASGVLPTVTFIDVLKVDLPMNLHTENVGGNVVDLDWGDANSVLAVAMGNAPDQVKLYNAIIATAPAFLSALSPGTSIISVDIHGDFMYLANYWGMIYVYDITDPADPIPAGSFDLGSTIQLISILAANPGASSEVTLLYVTALTRGLMVLNVSDPGAISQIAWFDTGDEATAVTVHNDLIYVGDGFAGIYVLELSEGTPVFFSSFQADASAGFVDLHWELASNEDLEGVRIYRQDGNGENRRDLLDGGLLGPTNTDFEDHSVEAGLSYFYTLGVVTSTGEVESERVSVSIPATSTRLFESYPNPFNPSSTIVFTLDRRGMARVRIFDASGRAVAVIADREFPAGRSELHWDGRDANGTTLSSGIYFYTLETERQYLSGKMMLVR